MAKKDLFLKQLESALRHAEMRHAQSAPGEFRPFDTDDVLDRLRVRDLMKAPIEALSEENTERAKRVLLLCSIEEGGHWHDEIAKMLRCVIRRTKEIDAIVAHETAERAKRKARDAEAA